MELLIPALPASLSFYMAQSSLGGIQAKAQAGLKSSSLHGASRGVPGLRTRLLATLPSSLGGGGLNAPAGQVFS